MKSLYKFFILFIFSGLDYFAFGQTIPTYTIAQVRGDNTFEGGGADSNNVKCKLVGIVYGQNIGVTGNRIQLVLRDQTGGIGIFKDVNNLPVQLFEGDSIRAIGIVNNFNGLSQITLDSVKKLGQNRPLRAPRVVTTLDESTESDLVKLEGFTLSNPAAWPAVPSGSGFTVKIKRNSVEVDLRIDNDCNLFGAPAPTGYFNVVGLGGQFDPSVPKNSGYQLLPRNDIDITPGLAPPIPSIGFVSKTLSVQESAGTVQIPLNISIVSGQQLVVQVVGLDSNATSPTDYTILQSGQVTFPANFPSNQILNLNIVNDALLEGNEKFKLIIRKLAGGGNLDIGNDSVMTITITDDETVVPQLPTYNIGLLRGNNAFEGGVADSINVSCKITGTLYGPNLRGTNNGIQFTVRDATGGIGIFKDASNFGLTLQEGDSVRAIGKVAQFNGLSQINLDSIVVLATGRTLKSPTPVDSLSEAYESDLVKVIGYTLVNPAQWTTGTGSGFTVKISNGTKTLDMRIDNDCPLFNQPVPTGNILSITGLVGQFDSSIPRNSGYQLFPRKVSDIEIGTKTDAFSKKMDLQIFPNPSTGLVNIKIGQNIDSRFEYAIYNSLGVQISNSKGNSIELSKTVSESLTACNPGIYYIKIKVDKELIIEKLIRN
jgi:DNA/RNA endonuclease YhcR with UshA esterase domain